MNANQVIIGGEYAISPLDVKPKGNAFIRNAFRVKVMRIFGAFEVGNKNQTMYVEGFRLNGTTGDIMSTTYVKHRVRDIIEDWDEYEDEAERQEVAQRKREAEYAEQRRIDNERYEAQRIKRQLLYDHEAALREEARLENERQLKKIKLRLGFKGLNTDDIYIDSYANKITIPLTEIKRWLDIT